MARLSLYYLPPPSQPHPPVFHFFLGGGWSVDCTDIKMWSRVAYNMQNVTCNFLDIYLLVSAESSLYRKKDFNRRKYTVYGDIYIYQCPDKKSGDITSGDKRSGRTKRPAGQNIRREKRPADKTPWGQNIHGTKRLWDKMSM